MDSSIHLSPPSGYTGAKDSWMKRAAPTDDRRVDQVRRAFPADAVVLRPGRPEHDAPGRRRNVRGNVDDRVVSTDGAMKRRRREQIRGHRLGSGPGQREPFVRRPRDRGDGMPLRNQQRNQAASDDPRGPCHENFHAVRSCKHRAGKHRAGPGNFRRLGRVLYPRWVYSRREYRERRPAPRRRLPASPRSRGVPHPHGARRGGPARLRDHGARRRAHARSREALARHALPDDPAAARAGAHPRDRATARLPKTTTKGGATTG